MHNADAAAGENETVICAIGLATGRSRRMGTQKLPLQFAGEPAIARIVDESATFHPRTQKVWRSASAIDRRGTRSVWCSV